METIKRAAQTALTVTLLGALVVSLGAPSLPATLALLGLALLSGLGLKKLGTFNQ